MTSEFLSVPFQQRALRANGLSHHTLTTNLHHGSQLSHRGFWGGIPHWGHLQTLLQVQVHDKMFTIWCHGVTT